MAQDDPVVVIRAHAPRRLMSSIAIAGGSGSHERPIVDRLSSFLYDLSSAPVTGGGAGLPEVHHANTVSVLDVIRESDLLLEPPLAHVKAHYPYADISFLVVTQIAIDIECLPIRAPAGSELTPGLAGIHADDVVRHWAVHVNIVWACLSKSLFLACTSVTLRCGSETVSRMDNEHVDIGSGRGPSRFTIG